MKKNKILISYIDIIDNKLKSTCINVTAKEAKRLCKEKEIEIIDYGIEYLSNYYRII